MNKYELIEKLGGNLNPEDLSTSFLRCETEVNTQGEVKFNLQAAVANAASVFEKLLAQSDSFVATHLKVGFKKIASATPTDANHAVAKVFSQPNASVFDGSNDANLQAVINGSLSINIDRVDYIPALDVECMTRVPELIQGDIAASNDTPTLSANSASSRVNGMWSYFPIDPIMFNGQQKTDFKITLPASVNMAEASETNYIVFMVKGYLLPNTNA